MTRSPLRLLRRGLAVVALSHLASATALAQQPASAPASPATATAAPAPAPTAPPAPPPVVAPPPKPSEPPPTPWYQRFELDAFVDAYWSINYNFPKPDVSAEVRALDQRNGFSLAWAGVNLGYPAAPVGGTISLRFGPAANLIAGPRESGYGIGFLKQAFVTWKATRRLTFDLGKFDTIIGGEVAESQLNPTYTRGLVFWLDQPVFHTGLRVGYAFTDTFGATLLAVNGWNNTVDNNTMKSFGLQLRYAPDGFSINLTYLGGPEQDETVTTTDAAGAETTKEVDGANRRWRHYVDLTATLAAGKRVNLILDGDYGVEDMGNDVFHKWGGVALTGRFAISEIFAAALRGEYHGDNYLFGSFMQHLVSGTLTLEAAIKKYLLIRFENRLDWAKEAIFKKGLGEVKNLEVTTLLGMVVKTN